MGMSFLDELFAAQDKESKKTKSESGPEDEGLDLQKLAFGQEKPIRQEVTGAILAVDIGSVYTRAVLLQVAEGSYHFVGRGQAVTTARPPWDDVLFGVTEALEQITQATGHQLLDPQDGLLIMPERSPFYGVSAFVATASAGEPVRALLVGLMPGVSLASGQRIAASSYSQIVETFSLADRRSQEKQVDAFLDAHPNLVLIVGGTDGGARNSLVKQIETVELACSLLDKYERPAVLYAGNKDLRDEVSRLLEGEVDLRVHMAENVRPSLDIEYLDGAQQEMARLFNVEKAANTGGFDELRSWTRDGIIPTAHAFGTLVRLLGHLNDQDALGVDVGSSATTIAAYVNKTPYLNVFDDLGIGYSAAGVAARLRPQNVARWISHELKSLDDIQDYIWNRATHPHTVPATEEDLEIELGILREVMRAALNDARQSWRGVRQYGLIPTFPTVVLSGSLLGNPPHYGLTAMAALDALLPTDLTRLYVDPYAMAPALGAIAPVSPRAVAQTLDTGAFIDLGTVISVVGRARRGDIVLRGRIKAADDEYPFEISFGQIVSLPLEPGQQAELTVQSSRVEVNLGGKKRRKLTVTGGLLGLIVDARGRPWRFPGNHAERRRWLREWRESITGVGSHET